MRSAAGSCRSRRRSSDVARRIDGRRIADAVEAGVTDGAYPGAVVLVGVTGESVYHQAFGRRSLEPDDGPMRPDTVFDLASLTKPLATGLAVMRLIGERKLRLDDRVTRFVPNFGVHDKGEVSIRHLLAHCSGLAAWRPFYRDVVRTAPRAPLDYLGTRGARDAVYEAIHREHLEYPTGTRGVYSDLGFMLLGELVELLTHQTLAQYCHERLHGPLGLRVTGFVDLSQLRRRNLVPIEEMIAPTERCPWRRRLLCGEVQDDNAYAMGGVAGHAGLFSSAGDVDRLVGMLRAAWLGDASVFSPELMREFWRRDGTVAESTWALAWDTPSAEGSSAGRHISANAVGHLGFTGTSVWFDLERDCYVIFLTNRVHPTRHNDRIKDVRPRVHDAVFEALDR